MCTFASVYHTSKSIQEYKYLSETYRYFMLLPNVNQNYKKIIYMNLCVEYK
jgi:hypothetical protein